MDQRIAVFKQLAYMYDLLRVLNNTIAYWLECRDHEAVREIQEQIVQTKGRIVELEAEVCL